MATPADRIATDAQQESPHMDSRITQYRAVREEVERSIIPKATSVDGRRFEYQASLHDLELEAGGYVAVDAPSGVQLGQVLSLRMDTVELQAGEGGGRFMVRLALGVGDLLDIGRPFHDAPIRPATLEEVGAWQKRIRPPSASLAIGELAVGHGVPFELDASGFGRHTFLCGQSGSGKTYSLGVLLEHLLMETRLRVLVLDPNSDYVRLSETRADVDPEAAARYREQAGHILVRRGAKEGNDRLALRVRDLTPQHRAALMRLDPIADRDEYAQMEAAAEAGTPESLYGLIEQEDSQRLVRRALNLGIDKYGLWSQNDDVSIVDDLVDGDARCLIADLGSLDTQEERSLVAGALLERLWRRRNDRQPIAIVIDEAHNVCPAVAGDALTALATEDAIRIAGEGRKFGLYLIVVSQRPQKVHENVLSQCHNLALMRMNSVADLGYLTDVFSFVPPGLIERATTFRMGEALVAGKFASHPALIRFGARLTEEGGADVAGWA